MHSYSNKTTSPVYEFVAVTGTICINIIYSGGLPGVKHAMLLANTKFLAMCGRYELLAVMEINYNIFAMGTYPDLPVSRHQISFLSTSLYTISLLR